MEPAPKQIAPKAPFVERRKFQLVNLEELQPLQRYLSVAALELF